MSTVEQQSVDISRNGGGDGRTFAVDNPATGETIAHLPDMDADQVHALVARARAAQKAWGEASFDDRAAVMYRARKWMTDNRERIAKTVMDETGKTREDAFIADVFTTADALGFWAKKAPSYLADERVRTHAVLASVLAISSITCTNVGGSSSAPPSERGSSMRNKPASCSASVSGAGSRRSASARSAWTAMVGASLHTRAT